MCRQLIVRQELVKLLDRVVGAGIAPPGRLFPIGNILGLAGLKIQFEIPIGNFSLVSRLLPDYNDTDREQK
jgi:hypothetical protein